MSDGLRFARNKSVAEAACYILLLAVCLLVFGSVANIDFLGFANDLLGLIFRVFQEALGIL